MELGEERCKPIPGQPTTYRGLHDMACWWDWSIEVERRSMGTYRQLIRPGDLCFDIGANRGRKTWIMRQLHARVIAVDPLFAFGTEFVPEFFWKWQGDPDVVPVPRAVSKQRQVDLSINKFMPYVSSMDRDWMTTSSHSPKHHQPYYKPTSLIQRRVPGITLDGLINIYGLPRFMKVDVEGAENSIIPTLSTPVYSLNLEFHRDWMPGPAMAHMETLGHYLWTYTLNNEGHFQTGWTTARTLLQIMDRKLTKDGSGSWGDVYGKLVE